MVSNPVIDMLIRIKNAQMNKSEYALVPHSKTKFKIANVLKEAGYLNSVEIKKKKGYKTEHDYLLLQIKYIDGQSVLSGIKFISKPSRKMFIRSKDIKLVRSGYGIAVISTPEGIMSSKDAKKKRLGGELMFEVW